MSRVLSAGIMTTPVITALMQLDCWPGFEPITPKVRSISAANSATTNGPEFMPQAEHDSLLLLLSWSGTDSVNINPDGRYNYHSALIVIRVLFYVVFAASFGLMRGENLRCKLWGRGWGEGQKIFCSRNERRVWAAGTDTEMK